MNIRYAIVLMASLVMAGPGTAQVSIDQPVFLMGPEASDRQVTGLPDSFHPEDPLTAGVEQRGEARSVIGLQTNLWQIDLPAFGASPVVGSQLVVRVPATTSGGVNIVLNGAGPFALKQGTEPVDGLMLVEGSMLSVVHDGTGFQILNGRNDLRRSCPEGMTAVNTQFCIDVTERPAQYFHGAALTCAASNRRLCSWSEFHAACLLESPLGLSTMTNNWEWTNNTSNEDNSARIVGLNGCETAGNWLATGNAGQAFRCCYSR